MVNNLENYGSRNAECMLEDIRSKLEYLTGVSKVCAFAYEHTDAYGSISQEETANAFFSINAQLNEITESVNEVISIFLADGAGIDT
jgi:hypothetical protein